MSSHDDDVLWAQIIFTGLPPKELTANGRRRTHPLVQHNLTTDTHHSFGWQARASWDGDPLDYPVAVEWLVVWPKGSRRGKGDLDNVVPLLKAVQDSCNGVVWHDDRQIVDARYAQTKDDTGTWPEGCVVMRVCEASPEMQADARLRAILASLEG